MLINDWIPLAGTVIGAGVAILVQHLNGAREKRREEQRWAREESRQWLEQRRQVYSEVAILQFRWLQALQQRDQEEGHLRERFREHLALLELLASAEVRNAGHNVLQAFENLGLGEDAAPSSGAARTPYDRAVIQFAYLNHVMRTDLGIREDP